jgi:hypothetical protein
MNLDSAKYTGNNLQPPIFTIGWVDYAHTSRAEALCVPCAFSLSSFPLAAFFLVACLPVACSLLLVAFFLSSLSSLSHTPYSLHHTPSFLTPSTKHILFSIKSVNYARLSLSLSLVRAHARENRIVII